MSEREAGHGTSFYERAVPGPELAIAATVATSITGPNEHRVGITVDGHALSEGECEAVAVLVACMRRGWGICWTPAGDDGRWYVIDDRPDTANWDDHWGRTPSEAYARALAAMEEGATDE